MFKAIIQKLDRIIQLLERIADQTTPATPETRKAMYDAQKDRVFRTHINQLLSEPEPAAKD